MTTIYSKEEFQAEIPCSKKDVSKLVTKGIIDPHNGFGESDLAAAKKWFEKNGPYAPTPKCKICGEKKAERTWHRCCSKCGATANGFKETYEKFGFSLVSKYNERRARPVCRECHRKYRNNPAAVKGKSLPTVSEKAKARARKKAKEAEAEEVAEAAMKTANVVELPSKIEIPIRKPYEPTIELEDVEELSFGPITLSTVERNTVEGETMVPEEDPGYIMDSREAIIIANALRNAEPTWIWGPSGIGKTSGVRQIAALLNWPLYRVQMSADFSLDDFVGTTEVVFDEGTGSAVTQFRDGVLIRAMLNGGILLVDEITGTPPHILLALQAVLERVENPHEAWEAGSPHCRFVNTANGGEVVHAHPNFRIIVTDNTNGQGDLLGLYAGTNVMNEATRSRFTQWYHKSFPDSETWKTILKAKVPGLHDKKCDSIVEIAETVNKGSRALGSKTAKCDAIINPRDTLAVARQAMTYDSVRIAFEVSILNAIHPSDPDRQYLGDLVKQIVGDH